VTVCPKLAINISLAVQTLAFSEGLLLAERASVDPRAVTIHKLSAIVSGVVPAVHFLAYIPRVAHSLRTD